MGVQVILVTWTDQLGKNLGIIGYYTPLKSNFQCAFSWPKLAFTDDF